MDIFLFLRCDKPPHTHGASMIAPVGHNSVPALSPWQSALMEESGRAATMKRIPVVVISVAGNISKIDLTFANLNYLWMYVSHTVRGETVEHHMGRCLRYLSNFMQQRGFLWILVRNFILFQCCKKASTSSPSRGRRNDIFLPCRPQKNRLTAHVIYLPNEAIFHN